MRLALTVFYTYIYIYIYVCWLCEFLDIKSNRYGKSVARRLLPMLTLLCQRISSSYVSLVFLVLACVAMALWFSGSFHLNSSSPYLYFMFFFLAYAVGCKYGYVVALLQLNLVRVL